MRTQKNFSVALKRYSQSPSYQQAKVQQLPTNSESKTIRDYENVVLNHMDNVKRRSLRHADDSDLKQIHASDVSALRKLNISEVNHSALRMQSEMYTRRTRYVKPTPTISETRVL